MSPLGWPPTESVHLEQICLNTVTVARHWRRSKLNAVKKSIPALNTVHCYLGILVNIISTWKKTHYNSFEEIWRQR